jgi:hypothetical protein
MEIKEVKWGRWFALGLGGLIGLSHIGMIGSLSNRQSKLPSINLPVGPYTSYEAEVGHDGYKISYKANDPKVMRVERDSNTKGGFLGLAEGTGRLVGSSVGASAAPALANIPFVGWVAAGWVTMFSGNQGAEIGGNMAEDLNKNC